MSLWKNLHNDKHIDWVLESLKTHTQLWHDTYNKEWVQARSQAWNQAWNQAREQAFSQAWWQAYSQAREQAREQAWYQARGACLALITYDDCAKYLSMTSDQLRVWAKISEDPGADYFCQWFK